MATRLKTIFYTFPSITGTLADSTPTALTQITAYIPDAGSSPVFRSVIAELTAMDLVTSGGSAVTTKRIDISVNGQTATSISNTNSIASTGEQIDPYVAQNFTAHFNTNWGNATSRTIDATVELANALATGFTNVCLTLQITYEYDDTTSTQIKTVMIPLDMPTSGLTNTATTYDTMPALDTYLPEASKTYRQIFIVMQGNTHRNASTTDFTATLRAGSATHTTGNWEGALATDVYFRYVWDATSAWPSTAATQTWQPTTSVTNRIHHGQAILFVTYEYNEASTSSVMNSVLLPMEFDSPMGGTADTDYQRATREFWIEEPATVTGQRIAYFAYWTQIAAIGGLNMRAGTGSFVSYGDQALQVAGSNAAMIRNDSATTLARGRNTLSADIYRTDTADLGWNVSGFWILNYTSGKSSAGTGAHNHTVFWDLLSTGTSVPVEQTTLSATAPVIPETNYFLNAVGTRFLFQSSGTVAIIGNTVQVERLSAEGGVQWETAYRDLQQNDVESGAYHSYSQMRSLFKRFPNDADTSRFDIETSRRWRLFTPANSATTTTLGWPHLSLIFTYHTITFTISGTVSGSSGGTVTINLCRATSGEKVLSTSRSGNGSYSFTWYDNTENMFTEARESSTLLGRSDNGTAT